MPGGAIAAASGVYARHHGHPRATLWSSCLQLSVGVGLIPLGSCMAGSSHDAAQVEGQAVGEARAHGGLTYLTIYNAGHMVWSHPLSHPPADP